MRIPLCKPAIGDEEYEGVKRVLDSRWLTSGKVNKEFEQEFARYIGIKNAISINSCTSAIQISIIASKLRGEIIMPSFTFVATANAVITSGCTPVLADIEYDTCNIDPDKISKLITKETCAIIPVHYGGQSCSMKPIMELAEDHGLIIIEDSAECIGGTYDGHKTGSFGIGCFSFFPTKNITTGEGGMITTNDDELALTMRRYVAHGIDKSKGKNPWNREAVLPGYNFRLSDINAALGLAQLKKIDKLNEKRRKCAIYLTKHLQELGLETPVEKQGNYHVYQMYTIRLPQGYDRDTFLINLRALGIEASVHFDPPLHKQGIYRSFRHGNLDVTDDISKRIVTLPMYPDLSQEELDMIITSVEKALKS